MRPRGYWWDLKISSGTPKAQIVPCVCCSSGSTCLMPRVPFLYVVLKHQRALTLCLHAMYLPRRCARPEHGVVRESSLRGSGGGHAQPIGGQSQVPLAATISRTPSVSVGVRQTQEVTASEQLARVDCSFREPNAWVWMCIAYVCVSHSVRILFGGQRKYSLHRILPFDGGYCLLFTLGTVPIDPAQRMPRRLPDAGIVRNPQAEERRGYRQHARPSPTIASERPSRGKETAEFFQPP